MTGTRLQKLGFRAGIWEGLLSGISGKEAPRIDVMAGGAALPDVQVRGGGADGWILSVPIPPEMLLDGIAVFVVTDAGSGATLGQFALAVGEPAEDDLRVELGLLRAELDLLKRAVRRLSDKG